MTGTTGTTQERLRDAATALGQTIQPGDIPPLRLRLPEPGRRAVPGREVVPGPGGTQGPGGTPGRRRGRRPAPGPG
ncbi:MAG TPA: hypothetical protein VIJ82_27390 [Streptosporangiaceae bacterium]|jgi:hypothetical protein